jgi:hypothetical protein
MKELDKSFTFMRELIANWLEGADHAEIVLVRDVITAELKRREMALSQAPNDDRLP